MDAQRKLSATFPDMQLPSDAEIIHQFLQGEVDIDDPDQNKAPLFDWSKLGRMHLEAPPQSQHNPKIVQKAAALRMSCEAVLELILPGPDGGYLGMANDRVYRTGLQLHRLHYRTAARLLVLPCLLQVTASWGGCWAPCRTGFPCSAASTWRA